MSDFCAVSSSTYIPSTFIHCSPLYTSHQSFYRYQSYMPDVYQDSNACSEEHSFWSKSPRSDSPSPVLGSGSVGFTSESGFTSPQYTHQHDHYQVYSDLHYQGLYKSGGFVDPVRVVPFEELSSVQVQGHGGVPIVRGVKRRNTANKKERRRTQSINAAFQDLRDRLPNVPADTKLSKIKTLRLATSYISYLAGVLETDEPVAGFRAELSAACGHAMQESTPPRLTHDMHVSSSDGSHLQDHPSPPKPDISPENGSASVVCSGRRAKGRTGWPQHVWALELKREQNL